MSEIPVPPSLDEQIACVRRELALRRRVYARRVEEGKMKPEDARHEYDAMKAVLTSLLFVQQTLKALNFYPLWLRGEHDLHEHMTRLVKKQKEHAQQQPATNTRPESRASGNRQDRPATRRQAEQDADDIVSLKETFETLGEEVFGESWPAVRRKMIDGYGARYLTPEMYEHAIGRLHMAKELPPEDRLPNPAPMRHVGDDDDNPFGRPQWKPPL